ncbi:MAG: hypothetical protein ACJ0P8_05105 [Flavobacteriales bacterium]
MENSNNLYKKLDRFIRKYYLNQLIRGGILTLILLLILFIAISVLEHYMNFDVVLRTVLFWFYIILNTLFVSKFIAIPFLKLIKLRKGIKYSDAAKIIGDHFKEIDDKLINVLELAEMNQNNDLVNASIEQKTASISPIPILNAINFKTNIKKGYWLLIPFALLFILFISGKQYIITDSSERILKHNTFFEPEAPYQIVFDGELLAEQYEDFELKLKITGNEIPKNFYVEFDNNKFMMQNKGNNHHLFLFKNIDKKKKIKINGGGYKSRDYLIDIIPKPIIESVKTKIIPPKYTKLSEEILNSIEDLSVPEGTTINWTMNLDNIDSVFFNLDNLVIEKELTDKFIARAKILSNQEGIFSYKNNYNHGDSLLFKINVLKDEYPSIKTNHIFDSLYNYVYIDGVLSDDYGLKRLTFNYNINSNNNNAYNQVELSISRDSEQNFYYEFNLDTIAINEGDEVNYFFEVWDNDMVNGSKKTKSSDYIFRKNSKQDNIAEKDQVNEKLKSSLNNSANKAQELTKEIEELTKEIITKKKIGWEEKQKAEEILKKQKDILKEIEENKKLNNIQQKKQSELNPSILEKQQQLKELMDNVIDEELKELLEEFEELLNEDEKDRLKDLLDKLDDKNEDLEKELDRELELFKQLEFEQKTEELIEEIQQLKEEQEKLKNETEEKKSNSEELAKEQEDLLKKMEEVKKSLDKLEDKNSQLENKNKLPETKELEKDISDLMQESQKDLNQNKKKNSQKKQKQSIEKLDELQNMLNSMLESNSEEMQIENIETLREILDNLIILSFNQEDLIFKTKKTKATSSEFTSLVREQKQLVNDSKIIEDSLFALSKRAVKIQAKINTEIAQIKDNMIESQKYLEERQIKKSAEKQQYVMTSANNLALLLSEILKNMQMDLSMMPSSCKKPKNCNNPKNSNSPSMSEIKKAQKQLNNKMKNGKQNGKDNKGKDKMSNKELMQLARKQGLIKSELENLKNQNEGSKGSKLVEEIKKQMEENEYDIINNKISNITFERLDQLIENFIDYEKAKKEEGEEEKRESNEWLLDRKIENDGFKTIVKERKKQLELINTKPINLKPYYKKEVNKYFNSLSKE